MVFCDTLIIKIASRCNINCTYCYMYNLGDNSYKNQPKFISQRTIEETVWKIKKHCNANNLTKFTFIFHGGEPLLMPKDEFVEMIDKMESIKYEGVNVSYSLQTNGILIDEEWCTIFDKYNIGIGVSIDGTKEINDKNRVDKKGNGTYDRVIEGIETSKKYQKGYLGFLSVINLDLDPLVAFQHMESIGALSADFLLLDLNYDTLENEKYEIEKTPSANWYIKIFDKWFFSDKKERMQIRLFDVIIHRILGGKYSIDNIGSGENNVLVLETDGSIEAVDVLKICGDSFTKNNVNIHTHSFEEALNAPLAEVYYNSGKYLPKKCLACPVNEICGGGYLPHRYSSKNGFNNTPVYCNDLLKLITHIQNVVVEEMPKDLINETGIQKLTYEDALSIIEETLPLISEPEYKEKLESFRRLEHEAI
ncbi:TPA: radical SAM protein [Elizabethkingia anophelis]